MSEEILDKLASLQVEVFASCPAASIERVAPGRTSVADRRHRRGPAGYNCCDPDFRMTIYFGYVLPARRSLAYDRSLPRCFPRIDHDSNTTARSTLDVDSGLGIQVRQWTRAWASATQLCCETSHGSSPPHPEHLQIGNWRSRTTNVRTEQAYRRSTLNPSAERFREPHHGLAKPHPGLSRAAPICHSRHPSESIFFRGMPIAEVRMSPPSGQKFQTIFLLGSRCWHDLDDLSSTLPGEEAGLDVAGRDTCRRIICGSMTFSRPRTPAAAGGTGRRSRYR
ncbi:hypothetical protein ABIB00_006306 [Bradyrhizobium sp. LB14.3]